MKHVYTIAPKGLKIVGFECAKLWRLKKIVLAAILMLFVNLGIAQTSQTGNPAATAASSSRSSAHDASTDLQETNSKANLLLNELRDLLKDTEKEKIFRESVGPGIIDKSNVLCPSVELKNLLLGDDRSKSVLIHDKAELKTFMNLITEAINFLEN